MQQVKFKPVFIVTQAPGVNYYRASCFADKLGGSIWPKEGLKCLPNWEEVLNSNHKILYDMEKEINGATVIIWQRLSSFRGLATMMGIKEKWKKTMYLEIDDDALHVDTENPGYLHLNPESEAYKTFIKQMELSAGIIVSTERLKQLYKKYNRNIIVLPNCIDLSKWKLQKKKGNKLVILWQGGRQHITDLNQIIPVVPKILNKYKNVEFHFMGYRPEALKVNRCFHYVPLLPFEYFKKVCDIRPDIVLAPLDLTNMNRARSNLRVLEAGAVKTPIIASANKLLPYKEIVEKSKGGMLVNNLKEWVDALEMLINDENLRKSLGENLYKEVRDNYALGNVANKLKDDLIKGATR